MQDILYINHDMSTNFKGMPWDRIPLQVCDDFQRALHIHHLQKETNNAHMCPV